MKKPKVNLSGAAIKEFFLNNGEKVGLGVGVAIMGLLIVMAIQQKSRSDDDDPKKISAKAEGMKTVIDTGGASGPPPVPVAAKVDVRPLLARVAASKVSTIEMPNPLQPPIRDERKLRGPVANFPLEQLQTFADRAPFLFKGAGAPAAVPGGAPVAGAPGAAPPAHGHVVQGRQFIMITGLIPLLKQQQEFDSKFENAQSPAMDVARPNGERVANPLRDVRYRAYAVERQEIINGKPTAPVAIPLGPIFAERTTWAVNSQEIVADGYTLQTDRGLPLTFPLPPMAIRHWDDRAAHKLVPLKADKPATGAVPKPDVKEGDPADPFAGQPHKPMDPNAAVAVAEAPQVIANRLFRFWDWSVEPGKTYQYRVQLIILNPNFGVPDRFLQDPALAAKEVAPTEWSAWSPPATIPRDHQLYLSSVDFNPAPNVREAQATVTCVTWDKQKGMEFVQDFKLLRGDFALFTAKASAPNPAGGERLTVNDFVFKPQMLLLDFRGGKSSPDSKRHKDDAEAVFWDMQSNQAVVHKQAVDFVHIEAAKARYQSAIAGGDPAVVPKPATNSADPGALLFGPPTGPVTPARPKGNPK